MLLKPLRCIFSISYFFFSYSHKRKIIKKKIRFKRKIFDFKQTSLILLPLPQCPSLLTCFCFSFISFFCTELPLGCQYHGTVVECGTCNFGGVGSSPVPCWILSVLEMVILWHYNTHFIISPVISYYFQPSSILLLAF